MSLTQKIKQHAYSLNFDLVGVFPVTPSQTIEVYSRWLAQGYAGKMGYLHKHLEKKKDIRHVMPEALSLVVLGINYHTLDLPESERDDPSKGVISSYAWGDDYHEVVREKLESFRSFVEGLVTTKPNTRVYVDTGPILEREYAQRAGLGWLGKNSMLIHPKKGSLLFLAEILLDFPLEPEEARSKVSGDCGSCTLCIDACPTEAIVEEGVVDATQCIAYLTIELKDVIPAQLRTSMGNRIFGCDICQEVCPWNRNAPVSTLPGFQPRPLNVTPNLISLMGMTQEEFSQRFKKSPIKRTKRRGFLRNVAIALGNWGAPEAIPALRLGLHDHESLVRLHSAWALGQIQTEEARQVLRDRLNEEQDPSVIQEIRNALSTLSVSANH